MNDVFLCQKERVKDLKKIYYKWELCDESVLAEQRYCHNCGKKVVFVDSGYRRFNANGKDIYGFAIYKCDNGHTWNKSLGVYKTKEAKSKFVDYKVEVKTKIDLINLNLCEKEGVKEIIISLEEVNGKWRLDKLLSQQIKDVSRTQIEKLINYGKILVNDKTVKYKQLLKKGNIIKILL